jgi:hypothetical protein
MFKLVQSKLTFAIAVIDAREDGIAALKQSNE